MELIMKPNRIGKFEIEDWEFDSWDAELIETFKHVVVLKAEHLPYKGVFQYVALSPLFEEQDMFSEPPSYRLHRERDVKTGKLVAISAEKL